MTSSYLAGQRLHVSADPTGPENMRVYTGCDGVMVLPIITEAEEVKRADNIKASSVAAAAKEVQAFAAAKARIG